MCKSMDWFLYDRDLRHERVTGRRSSFNIINFEDIEYTNLDVVVGFNDTFSTYLTKRIIYHLV